MLVIVASWALVACTEKSTFLTENVHPEGWLGDHREVVLQSANKATSCASCHGQNFQGGSAGVSCYQCHAGYPHPEGFGDPDAEDNFHEAYFVSSENWDLATCQGCHGMDYAGRPDTAPENAFPGRIESKNCLQCHTGPTGPEECNTCHGSSEGAAPPEDLFRNTETTALGVGAHQVHLSPSDISEATGVCSTCHVVPPVFSAEGHVDSPLPADVMFSGLADTLGADPVWDRNAASCSGSYCHGGFEFRREDSMNQWAYVGDAITGNDYQPVWTNVDGGEAECGTCHGLPPIGHINIPTCNSCHSSVVDADLNIIDPSKHINGEIDL
jgi:hypothetical protein